MEVQLESTGWNTTASTARIRVIGGNRSSIIGRDLMDKLGPKLIQQQPKVTVMAIDRDATDDLETRLSPWLEYFSKQFANLFKRVGKIRNCKIQEDFLENLNPVQQKGRRVPITLQQKVDKGISKLLEQGHIENLNEFLVKYFVSPIVIRVKKDGSFKLALESRELNKQVHKNKYKMPNIEELLNTVSKTISERKPGEIFLSTIDLTYKYGQLPLSANTSVQCNFSLIGGKLTGTYRFKNQFLRPYNDSGGISTDNG